MVRCAYIRPPLPPTNALHTMHLPHHATMWCVPLCEAGVGSGAAAHKGSAHASPLSTLTTVLCYCGIKFAAMPPELVHVPFERGAAGHDVCAGRVFALTGV